MAQPSRALAAAGPDGPDGMGREIAEGPDAVAATLAGVEELHGRLTPMLAAARRIVIVATGASLATAHVAAPMWRVRLDGSTRLLVRQSTEAALGDLDGLSAGRSDLVIAVSQSGASPETLAAARLARGAGASVLAVTAHADSALASTATLSVVLSSGQETGAATKSALAALAALLAIGGSLGTNAEQVDEVRDRLARTVADWSYSIGPGQRLGHARHTWMLGFGAAEGIASAASLLWHEKVVRPATAATPSEFRHGLIEAIGREDAVVLFAVPGDGEAPRYVDRLRSELGALEVDPIDLRPTAADPPVAALELLVRTQQLARAAALAAGTYREEFAILRHVVKPADDLLV